MTPDPNAPGTFQADWNAEKPGSYVTEVTAKRANAKDAAGSQEIGRDVLTFARMDGVAENFHTEQNRELLEKLSAQTGGRYWRPQELSKLAERHFLLRGRNYRARGQEFVEHAGDFPSITVVAVLRMAAPPEVGDCVTTGVTIRGAAARTTQCIAILAGLVFLCALPAQAAPYYVTVAGLGGEPDYEQRFTALAKDLDKLLKSSSSDAHVYTLTGADGHEGAL